MYKSKKYVSGLIVVFIVASLSYALSIIYNAPAMLFALLLGMTISFINHSIKFADGIDFAASVLLKIGIVLMGFRLIFEDINAFGFLPIVCIFFIVLLTLCFGIGLSYIFKKNITLGLVSGAGVAICGASAVLAVNAVLPTKLQKSNNSIFVIVTITILSTLSMIIFPVFAKFFDLSNFVSGFLIGSTIHDVAQVVGAGYSINDDAGILAIFFKMVRVLALPVVILAVSYWYNSRDRSVLNFPIFILGFLVTAFLANSVEFPDVIINSFVTISSWLLVCAIAAIGMKTQFSDMKKVELSLFLFVTMESIFILLLSLGFLNFVLK